MTNTDTVGIGRRVVAVTCGNGVPMNLPLPAPRRNWPGRLVNLAVALIVLAVAAGMFVFSYSGVRALALAAGMSAQLARLYPGLFDAVLVIACLAAIVFRDGRWWARCWAWLVIIIVLAAIGVTDVAHAVNYALPHRATEAAVAAAPLVAVLLAFTLLLTMLRHARTQAAGHPATQPLKALPPAPADSTAPPLPQFTPAGPLPVASPDPAPTRTDLVPGDYWEAGDTSAVTENAASGAARSTEIIETDSGTDTPTASHPSVPAVAQDAPSFATAPFATVPRLNRVRATPTPPGDDEDDTDNEGA
jgi:hypothetical protein